MKRRTMPLMLLFCTILLACGVAALLSACGVQSDFNSIDIEYSGRRMSIIWEATPDASSYDVYRAGSRLGEYRLIGSTSSKKYTDASPNANKYENYYKVVAKNQSEIIGEKIISLELKLFGDTMKIYDCNYDKIADIESEINSIHDNETSGRAKPVGGEFTDKRYALYLKPGQYEDFTKFQVGFYTQLAGLGATPTETALYGSIETPPHLSNNNATCTFWRSIENLRLSAGTFKWGVSQAAPVRRMDVTVKTEFDWNGGWASGGFSSDCVFKASVGSTTQQQWYARNCDFSSALANTGGYNQVVQGSTGALHSENFPGGGAKTLIEKTPVVREKPFLYLNGDSYKVFVPALKKETKGVSWTVDDIGDGYSLDLVNDFYIAKPGACDAATLNTALSNGKHIFFTPGRYELDQPLYISKADTVVLGAGYATLIPSAENKHGAIYIEDVDGVTVAGLMLDALYDSEYLICAGGSGADADHSANPTLLADLFLRIGGYKNENVNAGIAALINSNSVIGDHFWLWRADHGSGVGWNRNTAPYGLIAAGDDITVYGLFAEHFQKYQTLWLGERGRTYFYQCELPYDPTNQDAYKSHNGTVDGWAAYKVANTVSQHEAIGLGIYAVFNKTGENRDKSESVFLENAIEVPNSEGVTVKHVRLTDFSSENGAMTGMRSVINGTGNGVRAGGGSKVTDGAYVVRYNNGIAVTPSSNKQGSQPADETFDLPIGLCPEIVLNSGSNANTIGDGFDPAGLIIGLSVGGAAAAALAVTLFVIKKRKKN